MTLDQAAKLAGLAAQQQPSELTLITQLTQVVDTLLDRTLKLEAEVKRQGTLIDRLREFSPEVE